MQDTNISQTALTEQVVLATLMAGISLIFIPVGRDPGWQSFLASGVLAVIFLLTSLSMWAGSGWLGLLALTVLLLTTLWDHDKPAAAIIGVGLVMLNALRTSSPLHVNDEDAVHEQPEGELN